MWVNAFYHLRLLPQPRRVLFIWKNACDWTRQSVTTDTQTHTHTDKKVHTFKRLNSRRKEAARQWISKRLISCADIFSSETKPNLRAGQHAHNTRHTLTRTTHTRYTRRTHDAHKTHTHTTHITQRTRTKSPIFRAQTHTPFTNLRTKNCVCGHTPWTYSIRPTFVSSLAIFISFVWDEHLWS